MAFLAVCSNQATSALSPEQERQKSFQLLEQGKVTDSIKLFESTLRRNPTDMDSLLGMACALRQKKEPQKAAEYYRRLLKLRPANRLALISLVQILGIDPKSRAESASLLLNYVNEHPKDLPARKQLADLLALDPKTRTEALKQLKILTQLQPKDTKYILKIASLCDWTPDWKEAETHYRKYLALKPKDDVVRERLANLLAWQKKNKNEAIEQYDILLKGAGDNKRLRLAKAMGLSWNGGGKEAVAEFHKLLAADPDMMLDSNGKKTQLSLTAAEVARWSAHDNQAAEQFYTMYLAKHPDDLKVHVELAKLYSADKQTDKAVRQFDAILEKRPDDNTIRREKVYALMYNGRSKDSIPVIRQIAQKSPNFPIETWLLGRNRQVPATIALARTLDCCGETAQAKQEYTRIIASHPIDDLAKEALEEIENRGKGGHNYSLTELDELIRKNPSDMEFRMDKAVICLYMNKAEEALPLMQEVASKDPSRKGMFYLQFAMRERQAIVGVGQCYERLHKWSQAEQTWRTYLKTNPSDWAVRYELASLLSSRGTDASRRAALTEYAAIIESTPDEELKQICELSKIETLSFLKRYDEALNKINEMIAQNPDRPSVPGRSGEYVTPTLAKVRLLISSSSPQDAEAMLRSFSAEQKEKNKLIRRLLIEAMSAQKGKEQQAVDEANQLLLADPDDAIVRQMKAHVLFNSARYDEAILEFAKLPDEDRNNPYVIQHLADCLDRAGRHDESLSMLRSAVGSHADNLDLRTQLANTLAASQQKEEARKIYLSVLEESNNASPWVLRQVAEGMKQTTKDLDQSIAVLKEALKQYPDDVEITGQLADYLNECGRAQEAENYYRSALAHAPKSGSLYAGLAISLASQKRFDEAKQLVEPSILCSTGLDQTWRAWQMSNYPQLKPLVLKCLANAITAAGDHPIGDQLLCLSGLEIWDKQTQPDGIKRLRQYLAAHPADRQEWGVLANVLAWNNHVPESLQIYERLINEHPDDISLRFDMARAETASAKYRLKAIEHMKQYLALNPKDLKAQLSLADILVQTNQQSKGLNMLDDLNKKYPQNTDVEKSRSLAEIWYPPTKKVGLTHLEGYVSKHPEDPDTKRALAGVLSWSHGHEKRSAEIYAELCKARPEDEMLRYEYGNVMMRAGRAREALALFNSVLAKDPTNRLALLGICDYHLHNGDILKAEAELKKVRTLYPADEMAARKSAKNFIDIGRVDLALAEVHRWRDIVKQTEEPLLEE